MINIDSLTTIELIELYSKIIEKLKKDNIIRSNNFIGEIGEHIAVEYYNKIKGLPKLQLAPTGTKHIDAINTNGERFSIKSTSTKTTGVFYGLNDKGIVGKEKQLFEYVLIVVFDDTLSLKHIFQLDWDKFILHKGWHSRMKAWNLSITKKLINDCIEIYPNYKK